MSAEDANLQAQVEAVLGRLVKAAAVELIKVFESRIRVCAPSSGQRAAGTETFQLTDALSPGGTKRSVGVQAEPQGTFGRLVLPKDVRLQDPTEGKRQGAALGHNQVASARKQQVVLQTAEAVESCLCEADCPADGKSPTETLLDGEEQHGSVTKNKPLVVRPDTCERISPEKVKVVCPLILKSEALPPKRVKAVVAEPQQACVSTTRGSACSPPPSDGSLTPAEAGVWERVHTPEDKNDLHVKLKLTFPDQTLTRPCRVHLLDVLTVPRSEGTLQDGGATDQNCKGCTGAHQLKDLRQHQGLHTGHRICCFSPSGDGIWRLKKVVAHTHGGYACSVCRKTFARRKILRRHQRFHSGEKPYSCPACSKTFALRKSLRRHMRFHTGERPHVCVKCGKSFRLRENLKAHVRFHTGEKPFSCTTCGKMFRMARNLQKHQCPSAFVPSFRMIAGL